MKRTVLVVLATLLLACGLITAQPAGATYQGHVTWYRDYSGYPNPQCAKGYEVGTSVYGHAYIITKNYGYGWGTCDGGIDWYDDDNANGAFGWWAFRTRLEFTGGSVYSDWIMGPSAYSGIDTQYSNASPYPAQAIKACVETANWIWQTNSWTYNQGNDFCMYP